MGKKMLAVVAISIAVFHILGTAIFAGESSAKNPIKLSWSISWPPVICTNKFLAPWFVEEIEKRTGGRVKITIYHVGELLSPPQTYEGVVKGLADIGTSRFAFTLGRFPVAIGYEMPGIGYNNAYVSNNVLWDLYKKYQPKEMNDTRMLWVDSTGPAFLYTKQPIRTLEDFAGREIRADALVLDAIKALGGVPVSMPVTEVYLALQRGVITGTLDRFGGLKGFRIADVAKYIHLAPFIYSSAAFFNTMNLKVWNSLPPDIQKVFDEVGNEAVMKSAEIFEKDEQLGFDYAIKEKKMEIVPLSADELTRWKMKLKPVQEKWVADVEKQGMPGREMLAEQLSLTEKYNKKFPFVRGSASR